jgi:hypothetical protein
VTRATESNAIYSPKLYTAGSARRRSWPHARLNWARPKLHRPMEAANQGAVLKELAVLRLSPTCMYVFTHGSPNHDCWHSHLFQWRMEQKAVLPLACKCDQHGSMLKAIGAPSTNRIALPFVKPCCRPLYVCPQAIIERNFPLGHYFSENVNINIFWSFSCVY